MHADNALLHFFYFVLIHGGKARAEPDRPFPNFRAVKYVDRRTLPSSKTSGRWILSLKYCERVSREAWNEYKHYVYVQYHHHHLFGMSTNRLCMSVLPYQSAAFPPLWITGASSLLLWIFFFLAYCQHKEWMFMFDDGLKKNYNGWFVANVCIVLDICSMDGGANKKINWVYARTLTSSSRWFCDDKG